MRHLQDVTDACRHLKVRHGGLLFIVLCGYAIITNMTNIQGTQDELLDLVDDMDNVIGLMERGEVYSCQQW